MKPDPIEQLRRQLAQAARNGHFANRAGRDHLMRVNDLSHGAIRSDSASGPRELPTHSNTGSRFRDVADPFRPAPPRPLKAE